jgi:hypothetical protein
VAPATANLKKLRRVVVFMEGKPVTPYGMGETEMGVELSESKEVIGVMKCSIMTVLGEIKSRLSGPA